MYCLRAPNGELIEWTARPSDRECWELAFEAVCDALGVSWRTKYWKKWSQARRNARERGWQIVKCQLVRYLPPSPSM